MEHNRLNPQRPATSRPPSVQHVTGSGSDSDSGSTGQSGRAGGGDDRRRGADASRSSGNSRNLFKFVAVALLLLLGWFFIGRDSTYAGPEDQAPAYKQHQTASANPVRLGSSDIDRQLTRTATAAAQQGEPIPGIPNPSPALIDGLKAGKVTFYKIHVYDTCAEDGDIVSIVASNGGNFGPVNLTHAGTTYSVPVIDGQPPRVTLRADKDGNGGITVGAQTSGGVWYSAVIPEGGSQVIPLVMQ